MKLLTENNLTNETNLTDQNQQDILSVKVNPFIICDIDVTVDIPCNELNNNLYLNIFNTIKNEIQGKCYNHYGYIQDVQRIKQLNIINNDNDGYLINEDNDANVRYYTSVQCKICYPIKNDVLIAHLETFNDKLVILTCGPINIFNMIGNISSYTEQYKFDLKIGEYYYVKLNNIKFSHKDLAITAIGDILAQCTDNKQLEELFENIAFG